MKLTQGTVVDTLEEKAVSVLRKKNLATDEHRLTQIIPKTSVFICG
jgi:hypothetical protein